MLWWQAPEKDGMKIKNEKVPLSPGHQLIQMKNATKKKKKDKTRTAYPN